MTFVGCGFEHCVANMYLIPLGLLAKGIPVYKTFTMFHNIIPVTLGNIVGGFFIIAIHPHRIQQISNRLRHSSQDKIK
jgi:formate/nitrite transporter FocA (FNT family)